MSSRQSEVTKEYSLKQKIEGLRTCSSPGSLRIDHLVVVRESSPKAIMGDQPDLTAFGNMSKHTIDREDVKRLPGAQVIKALATDLVRTGPEAQRLREQLNAIPMLDLGSTRRNAVAYLIVVENEDGTVRVGYLLSVFSAAKAQYTSSKDERGNVQIRLDNAFTQTLVNLIDTHKIESLHAGPFHRIVRDSVIGNDLYKVVATNGTTLYYDGGKLEHTDQLGWTVQCMVADMQYKGVVKGLSMGRYSLLQAGCWPKAETQLPALGYKFRAESDRIPVPDETQRELVSDLIKWAADPRLSWADIADLLHTRHGYGHGVHKSREGEQVTIKDARHPAIAVKNALKVGLPLWLTGTYRYVESVARTMIIKEMPDGIRERVEKLPGGRSQLVVPLDFHHEELSEPWADKKTLHRAIRRLAAQSPYMKEQLRGNFVNPEEFDAIAGDVQVRERGPQGRAAATRTEHKPLSGLSEWEDGDLQWALSSRFDHGNYYALVSRHVKDARLPSGKRAGWRDCDRNITASMVPGELHKAMAEAAVEAIDQAGVKVTRSLTAGRPEATAHQPVDEATLTALAGEITTLQQAISKWETYEETALELGQRDNLARAMSKLDPLRADLRQKKDELARAQSASQEARAFDTETHAEFGTLAAALAALAQTEGSAPARLSVVLRDVFDDLRFKVSRDRLKVHFTFRVRVATEDGYVYLGPISGTVANHRRATKVHRRSVMFERMFRDGEDFQTAAAAAGYGDLIQAKKRVHDYLIEQGLFQTKGLRAAAMDCPIPEVRKILWAEHTARTEGSVFKVPEGIDPAYAEHIRDTYTSDREWALSWMVDNPGRARHALEMIAAAPDPEEGVEWGPLIAQVATGLTDGKRRYLIQELVRGKGSTTDTPQRVFTVYSPVLDVRGSIQRTSKDQKVRARKCPYCDARTLTHVVRVPEVLGGMICTQCRRSPHTPTVVFPESYLKKWVGPRGVGMGKNGGPGPGTKEAA